MSLTTIAVVQPSELGPQFSFNSTTGKWHIVGSGPSADAGNLLSTGTDGASLLTAATVKANQVTYILSLDTVNHRIALTDSTGAVTSIATSAIEAQLDDVTISADNTSITFNDRTYNREMTVNFANLLQTVAVANTNAITYSGNGTVANPLTATLVLDSLAGNLLKVGVNGACVAPADILALINANTSVSLSSSGNTMTSTVNGTNSSTTIINSNALAVNAAAGTIISTVNGIAAGANAVLLTNTGGGVLGYMFLGT